MPPISHAIVDQLLVPFMVRFFFVFGIGALAVGIGLVFFRAPALRFFGSMNRWVSLRRSTKWLAIPRASEPLVRRFRRPLGAVFVLVAAFSTFVLMTQVDADRVVTALRVKVPHTYGVWLMEAVRWFLVAGGMLAIAVGIMLLFFPQALLALETRANRWYSFRGVSRAGDTMHMGLDAWVANYPRSIGTIIATGALVVVIDFGMRLLMPLTS